MKYDLKEESAKDTGNKRLLAEVADSAPTLEQGVFHLCRAVCERLGANYCPYRGQTREGLCVDNWSACPSDPRQPTAAQVIAETQPEAVKAPTPARK